MSLMQALETRDASFLPGRRNEDWRWSDLKSVVRAVPPPSPDAAKPEAPPPLAELARRLEAEGYESFRTADVT
jgi:Fe-S cluster assembly protein SufD